jgi:hypothetical protein
MRATSWNLYFFNIRRNDSIMSASSSRVNSPTLYFHFNPGKEAC